MSFRMNSCKNTMWARAFAFLVCLFLSTGEMMAMQRPSTGDTEPARIAATSAAPRPTRAPPTPEHRATMQRLLDITSDALLPPPVLSFLLQPSCVACAHPASLQLVHEGEEAQEPCYLYRGGHPSAPHNLHAIGAIELRKGTRWVFKPGNGGWAGLEMKGEQFDCGAFRVAIPENGVIYRKPFKTQPENSHIVHNTRIQNRQLQINDLAPGLRLLHPYAALQQPGQSLLHVEPYYCTLGSMGAQSYLEMVRESELPETQRQIPFTLQDPPSDEEKMTLEAALNQGHARIFVETFDTDGQPFQRYLYVSICSAETTETTGGQIGVTFKRVVQNSIPLPPPPPEDIQLQLEMGVAPVRHPASLQLVYEGKAEEPCYLYRGGHPSAPHNLHAIGAIALTATKSGFFYNPETGGYVNFITHQDQLTHGLFQFPFRVGDVVYRKPFKIQPENSHIVHNTRIQNRQIQLNDLAPGWRLLHPYAALQQQGQSLLHVEPYYCTLGSMGAQSYLEMVRESELPETQRQIPFTLQDPPSDEEKMTLEEALRAGYAHIIVEGLLVGLEGPPIQHIYKSHAVRADSDFPHIIEVIFVYAETLDPQEGPQASEGAAAQSTSTATTESKPVSEPAAEEKTAPPSAEMAEEEASSPTAPPPPIFDKQAFGDQVQNFLRRHFTESDLEDFTPRTRQTALQKIEAGYQRAPEEPREAELRLMNLVIQHVAQGLHQKALQRGSLYGMMTYSDMASDAEERIARQAGRANERLEMEGQLALLEYFPVIGTPVTVWNTLEAYKRGDITAEEMSLAITLSTVPGGKALGKVAGGGRALKSAGRTLAGERKALEVERMVRDSLARKKGGGATEQVAPRGNGRSGRQARLRELAEDDKLGSVDRGWIRQEMTHIERGDRSHIRVPVGKELAHQRGFEAAKGFDYSYSNLQDKGLHRLQHKHDAGGRKNKTPAARPKDSES